ncbi:MAG: orotate phosphoribosyltransferase [Saprospiraceae bacterium]|nr:orotate phosphoribosyltransferase [Saprospiraceae bacterium]
MKNNAQRIAEKLLQINAVKLTPQNPFTWASGIKSPIYCDNRLVLSYPEARNLVVKSFVEKAAQFEPFDTIAGVATAGIPWGALLADRIKKPFIYIRDKPKSHGRQNQIEGLHTEGAKILVIEDLISTGGSSIKAVDAVRAVNCEVVGVLAIFSYGFEAATTIFNESKCPFDTLSNYEILLNCAVKRGYVTASDVETLQNWRTSPSTWGVNEI